MLQIFLVKTDIGLHEKFSNGYKVQGCVRLLYELLDAFYFDVLFEGRNLL